MPYGGKAEKALEAYEPVRDEILRKSGGRGDRQAVFLNHFGTRLTQRSVARLVKKYARLANVNCEFASTPHCGTRLPRTCWPMALTFARFRASSGPFFAFHHAAIHACHDPAAA